MSTDTSRPGTSRLGTPRSGRWIAALAFAAGLVGFGAPASANDSTARLDIGGLVLTSSAHLRMAEEDLFLSRDEVRVRYRFENTSDTDITTYVAFPLPPLTIGDDINYSVDARDPINFVDFKVTVDGRPVAVRTQARATRFGIDVTDVLNRHDIPITLFTVDPDEADVLFQRLNDMPPAERRDLERHGVMDWSSSTGANDKPLATPHWMAEIVFYWEQTFPANATIEVEHSYRPVPSVFFLGPNNFQDAQFTAQYCIDKDFQRAVARKVKEVRYGMLQGYELRYVLSTARNWFGPIGKFTLTIDKGSSDHLLSLCVDGIRKTSPTTFVHTAKDFFPEKDLDILFAAPIR